MRYYLNPEKLFCILISCYFPVFCNAQECAGAEIVTKELYLYGRFEVAMQSAPGEGIISSFFLFNTAVGCNWPQKNNEIDIEMTGNNELIYFTSHHPGTDRTWSLGDTFQFDFNPHQSFQNYAIEWEPGIVRWFVNGELVYFQDESEVSDLQDSVAILMNIWAADFTDWVGDWNPNILPRAAKYDYVRYAEFTPGNGNVGTNNNFTLQWEDSFDQLDTSRWTISDFKQLGHSYCNFRSTQVSVDQGILSLTLDLSSISNELIPVTFSVNTADLSLNATDQVFVNGTFNNWCGTCHPMEPQGNEWTITIGLPPGRYEYLYSINNWEDSGGAPLNSACDFLPCDEFLNYGFVLSEGQTQKKLPTYCWGSCNACISTAVQATSRPSTKKLLGIYDLMGRPVAPMNDCLLIYVYSDGSIEKKIHFSR